MKNEVPEVGILSAMFATNEGQQFGLSNSVFSKFVSNSVWMNLIYHGFWVLILTFLLPQICFDRPKWHRRVVVAENKIQEREK